MVRLRNSVYTKPLRYVHLAIRTLPTCIISVFTHCCDFSERIKFNFEKCWVVVRLVLLSIHENNFDLGTIRLQGEGKPLGRFMSSNRYMLVEIWWTEPQLWFAHAR